MDEIAQGFQGKLASGCKMRDMHDICTLCSNLSRVSLTRPSEYSSPPYHVATVGPGLWSVASWPDSCRLAYQCTSIPHDHPSTHIIPSLLLLLYSTSTLYRTVQLTVLHPFTDIYDGGYVLVCTTTIPVTARMGNSGMQDMLHLTQRRQTGQRGQ